MNHFETGWKNRSGVSVFARIWEPDDARPRGVVCLIHGIGEHSGRYHHVAEVFTREGLVLFARDMPGHGRSGGKRGHLSSARSILSDIDQLLDMAREKYPELPLFLYGHSLGGALVLYYGLKRRQGLTGVISTSPGLHNVLREKPLLVMGARVMGTLLPKMSISTNLDADAISRDSEVVKTYRQDPLVHDRMSFGFGKVMLGVIDYTMKHIGEFPYPLLLMHGTADTIAFSSGSEEVAAAIGNRCNLILWEEHFHELHNEPGKEEIIRKMTCWINGVMISSSPFIQPCQDPPLREY